MALGAYEQPWLDMNAAMRRDHRRRVRATATPFREISGPDGELLLEQAPQSDRGRRVVDSDIADAMVLMLQRVVTGGTGGARRSAGLWPARPAHPRAPVTSGCIGRDRPSSPTGIWLGLGSTTAPPRATAVAAAARLGPVHGVIREGNLPYAVPAQPRAHGPSFKANKTRREEASRPNRQPWGPGRPRAARPAKQPQAVAQESGQ